ncbi:T9SS type A sorting domain-containing protein [Hymenobacter busanensis]|uniref:T9SS type A sorting domain-containing protein n=1 Tax=Hymenobacter busanensis TaxID=2607656 RepID=A0A7L4ZXG6_9BACT|nr:T9SS type A sorting domain-containing protein [Hymenobacter busanensis]KAA9325280.1 T9SS type A sorting domain-containing protein [Hymenobacter busanensis]QHJ07727.1 T9SS type A sorting domain-containing protein [Hymenobacter busanensis]
MTQSYLFQRLLRRPTLTLAAVLGFGVLGAQGQALNYSAAGAVNTAGTFSALGATGTAIAVGDPDDDNSAAQNIGFTFVFNGQSFTQFVLNTNGALKLGNTAPSSDLDDFVSSTDPLDRNMLLPFLGDLVGTATSFKVATTGTAPNRVCTVEWSNMTEYTDGSTQPQFTGFAFQTKLYETSNRVEFVYGPSTPGTGPAALTYAIGVGLKGSGSNAGQLVVATKSVGQAWSAATFLNTYYPDPLNQTFDFDKTTLADAGRTFRFTPASCSPPSSVTFTGTTTTSTALNFTGPANGTSYTVIYGPTGFNPASAGTTITPAPTASPVNISGLAVGTAYDVYLRANCGATDQSALSGPFTITTSCGAATAVATFPYTQNFDAAVNGTLPCGITTLDANADSNPWINRSTVPTSAGEVSISASNPNAMVYFWNTNGTTAANDWFFTPQLLLRTGFRYQLSFKYRSSGASYAEGLEVKYGTGMTAADQTNLLWLNNSITNPAYVTANGTGMLPVTSITPTANGLYYIGFHAISAADKFFLAVDDLEITATPVSATSAALDRAISVYPNPSTGVVTLDVRGASAKNGLQVEVTNMLGQRVHTATVRDNFENKLDLSALANGMYVLKVQSGSEFSIRNISVQK